MQNRSLVKLSTANAELAAANDDLTSQVAFYKEQGDLNGQLEEVNDQFRNKIQDSSRNSFFYSERIRRFKPRNRMDKVKTA